MTDKITSVGDVLKAAREGRGLSIEQVAKEICVRTSYLKDIEAGHHDRLPEATFSVGFVRAYAKMLALDCDSIVSAFKEEFGVATAPVAGGGEPADLRAETPRRGLPGWLSPVAGLIGVSACWFMLGGNLASIGFATANTDAAELASVAAEKAQLAAVKAMLPKTDTAVQTVETASVQMAETTAAEAPAAETPAAETPAAETAGAPADKAPGYHEPRSLFLPAAHASTHAAPGSAASDIRLEAMEDAWVRLANADGSELWSGVLRRGQSYRPQHEGAILLSTSNAGGLMVKVGADEPRLLGRRGEIVSDRRLGNTRLSAVDEGHPGQTGSR